MNLLVVIIDDMGWKAALSLTTFGQVAANALAKPDGVMEVRRGEEAAFRAAVPEDVLAVVRTLWPLHYERRVKLRLVDVTLPGLERQLDLFDRPEPGRRGGQADSKHLDAALDRIRDRHGFGAVVRGRTVGLQYHVPASAQGFTLHTPTCSRKERPAASPQAPLALTLVMRMSREKTWLRTV